LSEHDRTGVSGLPEYMELPMSVQLAILGLLQERNYHGYELKKCIEQRMGMWTDIKFGSIYHALGSLEHAGFVRKVKTSSIHGKPARSIYKITHDGKKEFETLLRKNILELHRIFLKEDIGIYFGGGLVPEEFDAVLASRIEMMNKIIDVLIEHRKHMDTYSPERARVAYLLVTHHITHLEVERDWFQRIRRELKTGKLYSDG